MLQRKNLRIVVQETSYLDVLQNFQARILEAYGPYPRVRTHFVQNKVVFVVHFNLILLQSICVVVVFVRLSYWKVTKRNVRSSSNSPGSSGRAFLCAFGFVLPNVSFTPDCLPPVSWQDLLNRIQQLQGLWAQQCRLMRFWQLPCAKRSDVKWQWQSRGEKWGSLKTCLTKKECLAFPGPNTVFLTSCRTCEYRTDWCTNCTKMKTRNWWKGGDLNTVFFAKWIR